MKARVRPFSRYLIHYPHLNPSLATGILWVGPFGRRFPPVLPAHFTERHWYEVSGLALKEVLVRGWGLGGSESWESGRGPSQQGGRSWRRHRREETANQRRGFSAMSLVSPGVSGVGSQVDTKAGLKAGVEFESFLGAWCLVCARRRGGTQSLLTE